MTALFKRLRLSLATAALAFAVVIGAAPAVASAEYDPAPWTQVALPAPYGWDTTTSNLCPDGSVTCVDNTAQALQTQVNPLIDTCDHKLIFNFYYLRMTQKYRTKVNNPNYFQNNAFHNRLAVVFASYYTNQYQAWVAGDLSKVSPAWQEAFLAADNKSLTATGDALLAINAHIVGDESFALDQMGLVLPNGQSAKPDYDKDNQWLYQAAGEAQVEAGRRFDPALTPIPQSGPFSYQAIAGWREQAWRHAEQLKAAEEVAKVNPALGKTMAETVRAEINAVTMANAQAIKAAFPASAQQTTDRYNFCMAHHYDA